MTVLLLLAALMLPNLPVKLVDESLPRSLMAGRANPQVLAWYLVILISRAVVFALAVGAALQAGGVRVSASRWVGLRALPAVLTIVLLASLPQLVFQVAAALNPDLFPALGVSEIGLLFMAVGLAGMLATMLILAFSLSAGAVALVERHGFGDSFKRAFALSRRGRWTVILGLLATSLLVVLASAPGLVLLAMNVPKAPLISHLLTTLLSNVQFLFWWLASAAFYLDRREAHDGLNDELLETFD
ncbi:hypothetical protein QO010_003586 [Caulobacter ginsengisoli]|uniref:Glycerophosphoryl diester phosphodiesterase membrane domain-containing protein n=1 Tax=Caulobacter ginsengisoli TaxID=400775 RepID=A0ABU0IXL9_9CAUL|nr:hypothetical protein [Caulobacter ginsengisoli]